MSAIFFFNVQLYGIREIYTLGPKITEKIYLCIRFIMLCFEDSYRNGSLLFLSSWYEILWEELDLVLRSKVK